MLKSMLAHTFKYQSVQLFDLLGALVGTDLECHGPELRLKTMPSEGIVVELCQYYGSQTSLLTHKK
ncbi:hypothetical protein DSUL_140064 [Desulfovibrionales bacterium]